MTQQLFNGSDYVPQRDDVRLAGQLLRIWNVIQDGHWFTLKRVADLTGAPEASVSAQLRHLRKARFGGHQIEKEYLLNGLFRYRLIQAVPDSVPVDSCENLESRVTH